MYNNKGESKMDKTILIIRRTDFGSSTCPSYWVEKSASSLERATEYLVALQTLNNDKAISYSLFNAFGQFDVDEKEKAVEENA
tara:strand:- start:606 stop:854 length:249 start_codon:yes stop_codon:yes gene_type:complete